MKGIMITAFTALVNGEVVKLTPDNFDEITGKGKVLVKFFAPWCGHCKNMAPHYEKDSESLDEGVVLAECDCDEASNKEICSKNGIQGFPTLKWFEGDGADPMEYDGGRSEGSFKQWTSDIIKPVVQDVTEVPTVAEGERIQLTFHAAELSEDFEKVAKANRKHAVFNFLKADGDAKVTLHRHNEEDVESAEVGADALTKMVNDYRFPLFGELNGETFGDYSSREGRDMLWTLLKFEEGKMAESVKAVRSDMEGLAKKFDKYSFTFTDTVQFAQPIEGMLGVTSDMLPAVVVQSGKKKFVMKKEVNAANVEEFLNGIADGSVEADVKSEPVPETNDGPVRQVVAKTMAEELFQEDKDVLLKAYAPWCGHCKNMAEDYKSVGAELPKDKIVIAEIDGSANDSTVEGVEWQGFPTLFWIPKGSKEVKPYDGPRDKAGMLEWIKKNASTDLSAEVEAIFDKEAEPTEEL